jgi:predicted ATP-grasp superfamily ATP-dependent carboligase
MIKNPGTIVIEGHVQGLSNTRSLGEAGIPVYIVDNKNCIARYSKYCLRFFKCPNFESDEFADFLIKLAIDHCLKDWLLFPSNDHAVLTLSRHKDRLEKYFKVITPALNIIENIYDKSRLLELAIKVGVPVPATYYATNTYPRDMTLTFPILTKGRFGLNFYKATGRKAFLANNLNELQLQLEQIEKVFPINKTFTQELIPYDGTNKTISFTAFCDKGQIKAYWMGVKIREHPLRFGTATFAKSIHINECLEQSIPFLKELNYTGVCEVEYLLDPRTKEYKLIEINARTWLWVGLAKACGVNYALIIYNFLTGNNIYFPTDYQKNISWINWFTDLPVSFISILKKKISIKDYSMSLKGTKIDALWNKDDKKPYFSYFFLLPFFKLTR